MKRRLKNEIDSVITTGNRKLFAKRFRAARLAKGLSQADVAIAIQHGASGQAYISDIENGRQNVTIDTMSWLASIVGVSLADLVRDGNRPSDVVVTDKKKSR